MFCVVTLFNCLLLCRFILSEEDEMDQSWEQRLVKRYHDKLFKEYPLQINAIFITELSCILKRRCIKLFSLAVLNYSTDI